MSLREVPVGTDVPNDINVIIEIPMNSPAIKYEVDKASGALFVDRMLKTAMHYPCNYGYVPHTICGDGDPVDVLLVMPMPVQSGAVVRCRPIGLLRMEDESGDDAKVIAVPVEEVTGTSSPSTTSTSCCSCRFRISSTTTRTWSATSGCGSTAGKMPIRPGARSSRPLPASTKRPRNRITEQALQAMITDVPSYKEHWNKRANSPENAIAAVDGSTSEEIVRHTGRYTARQVRAALDIQPADTVLELGCGVGRIGRELSEHCSHWTGVDISENMISHARERLSDRGNVSFHHLSRSSLEPLADESVDKAYSIAVFCHMDKEDLYLYLQDLSRIIRPQGLILVETWNLCHPVGWRRWEYEPGVWSRADQSQRKDVARNQFCTPEEFALYVSKAGFEVLANYSDSQSVQIVAGKGLSVEDQQAQRQRLEARRGEIAYSGLYAELFGQFVDVIFGVLTATEMLAYIDSLGDCPEAKLYRPYLVSLWRKNAELWGPAPE